VKRAAKLLALLFVLSLPAVTTRIYASDEIQYFSWLRSWAFDQDADFDNEYRYFYDTGATRDPLFHETFLERTNEAGRRINFAPIGTAILWAPFYAVTHVVAIVTGAPANGLSAPYIAAVSYGSACYGFLAVLLSAAITRRIAGRGLPAAVVVCVGTPLVYYMYVTPPFSHACSAFAVALFLYVWLRVRETWSTRGVALLAVTGALMAMVREQDVFFVIGPAIDFVRHWALGTRHWDASAPSASTEAPGTKHPALSTIAVRVLAAAVCFALAYAPQVLAYYALNGRPRPTELVERKMIWTSPHALEVLFSPHHGLFAWTPLALLALAGLVWLAVSRRGATHHDARWIGIIALSMVAAEIYITGAVDSWTLAGAFGQRRFIALTPLFTLGMGVIFVRVPASGRKVARAALAAAVVLCIWWNLGLILQFALHRMNRQQLTLKENAWNTFVVLPRELPAIAIRYLTDRSSFYGQPRR
jgi:hypothetical protein